MLANIRFEVLESEVEPHVEILKFPRGKGKMPT